MGSEHQDKGGVHADPQDADPKRGAIIGPQDDPQDVDLKRGAIINPQGLDPERGAQVNHNHYLPLALKLVSGLTKLMRPMNMRWTNNLIWITTQRHKSKFWAQRSQEIGELQQCPVSKEN